MNMRARFILILALTVVMATAGSARAQGGTQHLISPGENWQRLADRIQPGDEIILMPGRHRPAHFDRLKGEEGKPITIRGFNQENPGLIIAEREGLKISRPQHVVLQDLIVTGAALNGINIDDGGIDPRRAAGAQPWTANLIIRRVSVQRTGPRGNADGIKLSGLRDVLIVDSSIEAWGGSGIDLVGCHAVSIERTTFRGAEAYDQANGIQIKGGSSNVTVTGCTFIDAGRRGINLGGSTGLNYFRPGVADDARAGSQFEARQVTIERCIFRGGDAAIAFVGSTDATVRQCTIIQPKLWAFRILQENRDPRFGPTQRGRIGENIIIFDPEQVERVFNIGPDTDPASFTIEENLWWAIGREKAVLTHLPVAPSVPQLVDVDPQLDDAFRPQNQAARFFGARID